jgi:FkbM family methyltransferase
MYSRTPFRQLRQIYASILALGRLPSIAEDLNKTIAAAGAQHIAALGRLEGLGVPSPTQPVPLAAVPPSMSDEKPRQLDAFRAQLLEAVKERMLCVDVGARWGADSALLSLKSKAKLLCFDPDEEECARLQIGHSIEDIEYVPLALSENGLDLHLTVTAEPSGSSVYLPVETLYKRYPALAMITPAKVVTVQTVYLDKYLAERGMAKPSLFKLDTQGSELDILKGAQANLSEASLIDIEVQFNPLYVGAGLFGDVDVFLRSQGFSLWRLPLIVHYTQQHMPTAATSVQTISTPPGVMETTNPGNGQLFWGQAHYVRTDCLNTNSIQLSAQIALRTAAIASAYGYWDLALMALTKCQDTQGHAEALSAILDA